MNKNIRYEYDIVDAEYGYVIVSETTRLAARKTKSIYKGDYPSQKFAIIQRKFKLEQQKEIR